MAINITNVLATNHCVILCLSDRVTNSNDRKNIWKNPANYELRRGTAGGTEMIALDDTQVTYTEEIPAVIILTTNAEGDRLWLTCKNLEETFDTTVVARSSPANPDESTIEEIPVPDEGQPPIEETPTPVEVPNPETDPDEVLTRVRNIDTNITTAATVLSGLSLPRFEAIPDQLTKLEELVLSVKMIVSQPVNPSLQAIKDQLIQTKADVQASSPDNADEEGGHETEWKQTLVTNQITLWKGLLPLIQEALKSQDIRTDMQAKLKLLQSDVNASLGYFYGNRSGVEFFTWQQLKGDALGRINTALTRTN